MTATGTGRGKLILFGEHAAVHGHSAVGLPLDCSIVVAWMERARKEADGAEGIGLLEPNGSVDESDSRTFADLLAALEQLRPSLRPEGGTWSIRGNVSRAGGFGSSAALCVALSRLALGRPDRGYDRDVHLLAHQLERRFHGTPSGIDTGMACDGRPAAWRKSDGGVPDRLPLAIGELPLLYGALPRSAPTAKTVAGLASRLFSGDRNVSGAMDGLGRIAEEFINLCGSAAETSSPAPGCSFALQTGSLADRAQSLLASVGLSAPELDEILLLAKELGGVGGKLSGGGMGGAFFLCAPDTTVRDRLAAELPPFLAARNIVLAHPLTPLDAGFPR